MEDAITFESEDMKDPVNKVNMVSQPLLKPVLQSRPMEPARFLGRNGQSLQASIDYGSKMPRGFYQLNRKSKL